MASMPEDRVGPPPRSLAVDAHDLYERHRVNPFLQPMTNIFIELCSNYNLLSLRQLPHFFAFLGERPPSFRRKHCPSLTTYPRRSPNGMRHSPHKLISGRNRVRTKVPHASLRGQRGLQGGWDPSASRLLSASHAHGHTSTLDRDISSRSCLDLCASVF